MKPVHEMMADKMDEADGAPSDDGNDGDDYGDGLKSAMSALIDAIHSKDADAAAEAFENAMDICNGKSGGKDDGEGGGHAALLLMPHPKG